MLQRMDRGIPSANNADNGIALRTGLEGTAKQQSLRGSTKGSVCVHKDKELQTQVSGETEIQEVKIFTLRHTNRRAWQRATTSFGRRNEQIGAPKGRTGPRRLLAHSRI